MYDEWTNCSRTTGEGMTLVVASLRVEGQHQVSGGNINGGGPFRITNLQTTKLFRLKRSLTALLNRTLRACPYKFKKCNLLSEQFWWTYRLPLLKESYSATGYPRALLSPVFREQINKNYKEENILHTKQISMLKNTAFVHSILISSKSR